MVNPKGPTNNFTINKDDWLESIMDEYGERLTRLAYNYIKDWGTAQDVVQEVFVTCYKQYESIENLNSFKSWVFRITINKSKDVLRKTSIRKRIINKNLLSLFSTNEITPELNIIKRDEEEFLAHCVLSLPLKYREVIILFYYEELSIEEIGELLKINVKTRLNRGRMKIKVAMERGELDG